MVNSVNSISTSSVSTSNTRELSEEEKEKLQDEGLFPAQDKDPSQKNQTTTTLTEDNARTEALSYINILKSKYPQLAAKLDSYYSNLDFSVLCSEAATATDVRAYIFSETQSYFN